MIEALEGYLESFRIISSLLGGSDVAEEDSGDRGEVVGGA